MTVKETNLYLPVCRFFEKEGYVVQAEVNHCDLVAVKENEIILVELKGSFCLKLVYQAMERQRISDMVFVAIPRPKTGQKQKSWKQMIQLLERLDIGLLTVALDSPLQTVETVLLPNKNKVRKNTKKQKKKIKKRNFRAEFDCQCRWYNKEKNHHRISRKSVGIMLYIGTKTVCVVQNIAVMGDTRKNIVDIA